MVPCVVTVKICRYSPGEALVHLRGTGDIISMFESVTQPPGVGCWRGRTTVLAWWLEAHSPGSGPPFRGEADTNFHKSFLLLVRRSSSTLPHRAQSGLCHPGVSHSHHVTLHRRARGVACVLPLFLRASYDVQVLFPTSPLLH